MVLFFKKCNINLEALLQASCKIETLIGSGCKIPVFYVNAIRDWCQHVQTGVDRKRFIWYNKDIRVNGTATFMKEFYERGIKYVGDIVQYKNSMQLFNVLVKKGLSKTKWLRWQSIVQAVKQYCKRENICETVDESEVVKFQITETDIEQCNSKFMYNTIVNGENNVCIGRSNKHVKEVNEWQQIYTRPMRMIQDVKTRDFQYRFLHDILVNKYWLYKWKIVDNNVCRLCKQCTEDLLHLFWDCEITKQFWKEFNEHFNVYDITVDKEIVFYGSENELGCCLVFAAKRHVYKCVYDERIPTFKEYMNKVYYMKMMEEQIANNAKKHKRWEKKWMPLL